MYLTSPYDSPPAPPDLNAHHIFFDRPDQREGIFPWDTDYTIYIDLKTGTHTSFREFKAKLVRIRTALSLAGFGKENGESQGELVGMMCENCLDYPLLVHALMSLGIPIALIAPYSTPFELAHALKLTGLRKVFAGSKQIGMAWPDSVEVFAMNNATGGSDSTGILVNGRIAESLEELLRAAEGRPEVGVRPMKKSDLAYLVFSSGTSGLPKAVMITHGNLIYSIFQLGVMGRAAAEVAATQSPTVDGQAPAPIPVALGFLPMHHSYGLHAYIFRAFLTPVTFVLQGKWDLREALQAIVKYRVTNLTMIPSAITQLVSHPDPSAVKKAVKTLKTISCGAAYLPPELATKMRRLSPTELTLTEGYGMSEATIAAVIQPQDGALGGRLRALPGSCGVLLPGMEARILDDNGRHVETGEAGELWLRSENISPGYFGTTPEVAKANQETFVDGWLRTGDKFYLDANDNFYFADRSKDTLKISGIQVSPLELENVLLAHPEKLISDVAVAGVHGFGRTRDEKVPRAWVVLSEGGRDFVARHGGKDKLARELIQWCQAQVSRYKWLRGGIEIVDEIPKSPTGKTLRRLLVAKHEESRKVQPKL